ncbi:hypothetical protein [Hymenobacter baengnokdamensis]|uniref:hypothetical protein n=1 Tax=Hymenobacter baengnokdamensis TaxID=2615203 RepID=UPI0017858F6D|nr:hypothetical protein [Hymenobacter baengnokdamensis]
MAVILQRHATHKAPEHHRLLALIHPHLDKEAASHISEVVEVDAALILPALPLSTCRA